MIPLDQDIDDGLGWFRGVVPGGGTTPRTTQEPPPEPPPQNQPQNKLIPEVVPRLEPTLDLSRPGVRLAEDANSSRRKKNPASGLDGRERNAAV